MATSAYLEQIEQKIYLLQNEGKLSQAYDLCKLYLSQYPEERSLHKLKAEVEQSIQEANEKVVEAKLKELDPLWKTEEYSKILKALKDLLKYSPNHKELKSQYQEAQKKYQAQIEFQSQEFKRKQSVRFEKLLQENENGLISELIFLEKANPGNPQVTTLIKDFRDKLIRKKVAEKSELMSSGKFDAMENLLDQLRKIDSQNNYIKELEDQIKIRRHENQNDQKREFVYQGITHLDTLMKLKKYDKAMKAANEILNSDPQNQMAQKILKEAEKKLFLQTRDLTINKMLEEQEKAKTQSPDQKDQFISI